MMGSGKSLSGGTEGTLKTESNWTNRDEVERKTHFRRTGKRMRRPGLGNLSFWLSESLVANGI